MSYLTQQNVIYTLRFSQDLARRLYLRIYNKRNLPLAEYKRLKKLLDHYRRSCYILDYNLRHGKIS